MSDLPLDETALQAAAESMWGEHWEEAGRCYPWDIEMADCQEAVEQVRLGISTYLREARFELEYDYPNVGSPDERNRPFARHLIGPRVPIVQAESEEE